MIDGLPTPDWQSPCGDYVLYHGDCLEILPQLPDGCVDAVVTDPPWNCGYFGEKDAAPWREYKAILTGWLARCERICDGQVWFLSTKSIPHVSDLFSEGYKPFASVKNFSQMTKHSLPNCWDIAFIRDGMRQYQANGRNWFLANTAGMLKERTRHPTPRSLDVMLYVLGMYSWGTILDPFTGSGTTGVACVKTGRKFIGIELEKTYFDIAVERIEKALNAAPLLQEATHD